MLGDRPWTIFQIDAEIDMCGSARIVQVANRWRAERDRMRDVVEAAILWTASKDAGCSAYEPGLVLARLVRALDTQEGEASVTMPVIRLEIARASARKKQEK